MSPILGDGFSRREFASVRKSIGKSTVAAARLISVIFCLDYTRRYIARRPVALQQSVDRPKDPRRVDRVRLSQGLSEQRGYFALDIYFTQR